MWVGRGEGGIGGGPTLVRRSHFNTETSASLNSGFNVLEALQFLLQLIFLFIYTRIFFFFFVSCIENVLDFPPSFLPAPAVRRIRGTREGLGAAVWSCVCVQQVGDGDLGAVLCPSASHPHQPSPPFLFV